jgi:undecaprenyl-diphosphatase
MSEHASDEAQDGWPLPAEDVLADRVSASERLPDSARVPITRLLRAIGRVDRTAYRAVARMPTAYLDTPLRRVAKLADFSKLWIIAAGLCSVFGGARGRRAAVTGLAAIGVTSFVVNQPMKIAGQRRRPDRDQLGVPHLRRVTMPQSTSFPSGHSASAAAFAVAAGNTLPTAAIPLRAAASVVAFSRVYTGVHYPADVLAGATVGAVIGHLTARAARRVGIRRARNET